MKQDPRTMSIINPELRGMPLRDYEEELNIRSHKAGHTARDGGPIPQKVMAQGIGESEVHKVWPRDEHTGELIDD